MPAQTMMNAADLTSSCIQRARAPRNWGACWTSIQFAPNDRNTPKQTSGSEGWPPHNTISDASIFDLRTPLCAGKIWRPPSPKPLKCLKRSMSGRSCLSGNRLDHIHFGNQHSDSRTRCASSHDHNAKGSTRGPRQRHAPSDQELLADAATPHHGPRIMNALPGKRIEVPTVPAARRQNSSRTTPRPDVQRGSSRAGRIRRRNRHHRRTVNGHQRYIELSTSMVDRLYASSAPPDRMSGCCKKIVDVEIVRVLGCLISGWCFAICAVNQQKQHDVGDVPLPDPCPQPLEAARKFRCDDRGRICSRPGKPEMNTKASAASLKPYCAMGTATKSSGMYRGNHP